MDADTHRSGPPDMGERGAAPSTPTARERRRALRILGLSVVAITFFAQDALGLLDHGGLWSVVAALHAAGAPAEAKVIDVDGSGLRSGITAVTCLVLGVAFGRLGLDIRRRGPLFAALLGMVGGSLALDAACGAPFIERLMAARGYRHCPGADHAVGEGRARVRFEAFVPLTAAAPACRGTG